MSDCHAKALLEVVLRKTFNGHSELSIFEPVREICEVARNPVHIGSEQFPGLGEAVREWYVLNQANLARVNWSARNSCPRIVGNQRRDAVRGDAYAKRSIDPPRKGNYLCFVAEVHKITENHK